MMENLINEKERDVTILEKKNTLLETILEINKISERSKLSEDSLIQAENELEILSNFYGISHKEALLLSAIIEISSRDAIRCKDLASYFNPNRSLDFFSLVYGFHQPHEFVCRVYSHDVIILPCKGTNNFLKPISKTQKKLHFWNRPQSYDNFRK